MQSAKLSGSLGILANVQARIGPRGRSSPARMLLRRSLEEPMAEQPAGCGRETGWKRREAMQRSPSPQKPWRSKTRKIMVPDDDGAPIFKCEM